jgi:hypothetical protein
MKKNEVYDIPVPIIQIISPDQESFDVNMLELLNLRIQLSINPEPGWCFIVDNEEFEIESDGKIRVIPPHPVFDLYDRLVYNYQFSKLYGITHLEDTPKDPKKCLP